jgi:hypothetical protein
MNISEISRHTFLALTASVFGCSAEGIDITVDEDDVTWYRDADGDGYSNGEVQIAVNRPADFYRASQLIATSGDCDDNNDTVHPGGIDLDGDGLDQDCNGFEISGPPEVVFDWTTDRCDDLDIPDLPARAFRDRNNQVQLISSHHETRRNIGPNLNNLVHDCTVVMSSHRDSDAGNFNDAEWIGATYTEDGETIYAIVHNEYHAWEHAGQCGLGPEYWSDCWYNGLTLAVSTDGGSSYDHPVAPPLHLIASYPEQYLVDQGPYGAFHPSNIVKRTDGYYYAFVHLVARDVSNQWACLMRTSDLSDPDAWRFWDGSLYEGEFVNPYTDQFADKNAHVCPAIGEIVSMSSSLVYSEYLGRYVLSGTGYAGETPGFYYSTSEDLVNWTPRALLLERDLPGNSSGQSSTVYLYPSILDPDSSSRNFEAVGKTVDVYYTRLNFGQGDLDRDLLRVPIEFFRY